MKTIIMAAMIISSISANAANLVSQQCITDTGKKVEIAYSEDHGNLDRVVINGATYTTAAYLTLTSRGAAMVYVTDFRGGATLQLVAQGKNSFYTLDGNERPMNCRKVTENSNGGI